ncbi:type VII secretion protein EccB [Nocardia sp. NPDC046473]|uniref:type VII secretion protein EccB n=1 Tax=Nocardia sp. NPDC046473 TaxID=3155733 RepID=UPI0033FC1916
MPAQLTTRAQVNGYRFLLQRFEHALVRRDVRMLHDPMRIQFRSLITGLVLAVLFTGGCMVMSYLKPDTKIGESKIVMGSVSGALYVVMDKTTLHPVLNLASARLVTGSAEAPTQIKDAKLNSLSRGPLLGIPGAPAALLGPDTADRSEWTLCDDTTSGVKTTLLDGTPRVSAQVRAVADDQALLATLGDATYLIYNGKHARVDMNNPAIVSALRVRGLRPRPMGTGLLNATVAAPELTVPGIANAGAPGPARLDKLVVGSVIRVDNSHDTTLYVVLSDGVQKVSAFTAEVLRTANSMGMAAIPLVSPDAISGVPVLDTLPVDQFPAERPTIVSADDQPIACATWSRGKADPTARLQLLAGKQLPLPVDARALTLVGGGLDGHADASYIPPASGEFVQVTGIEPDSTRRDGLFYVTDTGIRFGIPDAATAAMLGLSEPKLVPWQLLSQLPPGPMLDRQSALIARDTVRGDGTAR